MNIRFNLIKVRDSFYHQAGKEDEGLEICGSRLNQYFDLLPDDQPITVVVSNKPSKHAYKCILRFGNVVITKSDGSTTEHWLMDYTVDWLLARYPELGKKYFYVHILQ